MRGEGAGDLGGDAVVLAGRGRVGARGVDQGHARGRPSRPARATARRARTVGRRGGAAVAGVAIGRQHDDPARRRWWPGRRAAPDRGPAQLGPGRAQHRGGDVDPVGRSGRPGPLDLGPGAVALRLGLDGGGQRPARPAAVPGARGRSRPRPEPPASSATTASTRPWAKAVSAWWDRPATLLAGRLAPRPAGRRSRSTRPPPPTRRSHSEP